MPQAQRQPDNAPSSATERRRGGVQPPLLQKIDRRTDDPSSPPPAREAPNRRIEMGRLLKSCGVRFYWGLARDYPAELIEAKVAEWEEGPATGPGMLVRMIQEGGPVLEVEVEVEAWWEKEFSDWLCDHIEQGEYPPGFKGWLPVNQERYREAIQDARKGGD